MNHRTTSRKFIAPVVMFSVIATASLVWLSGLQSKCLAQAGGFGSLGDSVTVLEQRVGIPFVQGRSLVDRLSALEQRVFGNVHGGSLMERIDGVRRFIDQPAGAQGAPQQAPPIAPQNPQQFQQQAPQQFQQAPQQLQQSPPQFQQAPQQPQQGQVPQQLQQLFPQQFQQQVPQQINPTGQQLVPKATTSPAVPPTTASPAVPKATGALAAPKSAATPAAPKAATSPATSKAPASPTAAKAAAPPAVPKQAPTQAHHQVAPSAGDLSEHLNLKGPIATPASAPPQSQSAQLKNEPATKKEPVAPVAKSLGPLNNEEIKQLASALPSVNVMPPRFYRIESASTADAAAGNYIPDIMKATQNKVMRFKNMPIPVYITPFTNPLYMQACIQGFESWEGRTKGLVRFVQVKDPNQARIRVIWNSLGMTTDANNCALGAHTVTKWKKKPPGQVTMLNVGSIPVPLYIPRLGPKYQVPAQVIEVNVDLIASKNEEIRYIVLKNIVTHELGHAMGLLGHSPDHSDMMYEVTDENSRISRRDIETLGKIYEKKVDIGL